MIHTTCYRSRGFRYDKLGDSIESSSNKSRVIRKNNRVSPIKSLQRNLCPFEKRVPYRSLLLPYFLLLFISLSFASASSEDLFKSSSSKSHLLHSKQANIYRTANQGAFIVFPEERFLLHLTLIMSRLALRVSVRDGGLRAAAIAVGNLQHSPSVSSLCARAKVKDP